MSYERISLEFKNEVAQLTLDHPEALNALSMQMLRELHDAFDRVKDPANGARCLLFTGAGRGFCAGANLTDPEASLSEGERDPGTVLEQHYHPLLLTLRDLPMPVLTAVNGVAAGAGMSFALMGDMVLAAKSAYFLQAFRRIGLVPDAGSTYVLPRLVGWGRAMELAMMGERLPAETAHEWGLVNRLYEDDALPEEAVKLAEEVAHGPTKALTLIRRAMWRTWENSYEQQLHLERVFQREAGQTEDFIEGVTAFAEKREAKFKGR
ncbi:MAG: enoyl-CoA hydratase/isomerase [Alphaproteobacteria bacterium]